MPPFVAAMTSEYVVVSSPSGEMNGHGAPWSSVPVTSTVSSVGSGRLAIGQLRVRQLGLELRVFLFEPRGQAQLGRRPFPATEVEPLGMRRSRPAEERARRR